MRKFNFSTWAVTRSSLTLLAMIMVLIAGIFSYTQLTRSEDPEIESPMLSIIVPWPGATAEQIEAEIIDPLEKSLHIVNDVEYMHSFSRQGYGGLIIALDGGISSKKIQERWDEVNKKVDQVKQGFPEGAESPQINDQLSNIYSRIYALTGEGFSSRELHQVARRLQKELMQNKLVSKVDILGAQSEAIYVEFKATQLAALGLTPATLASAIQEHNQIAPSGLMSGQNDQLFFRVNSGLGALKQIENIPIKTFTGVVLLRDVAKVSLKEQDAKDFVTHYNGSSAVMLAIVKKQEVNIYDFGMQLDRDLHAMDRQVPQGMVMNQFVNQPEVVKQSISGFEISFLVALLLVLLVAFVTLGLRAGLIVVLSIPLVFAIVAMVMNMCDWPLNRVSLGALIIALGLLVDDVILVIEMMMTRIELGWDKLRAASYAYTTVAFPMLTGTLITLIGLLPVAIAKTSAAQYTSILFWVVAIALLAAWVVAIWFIPFLGLHLLKHKDHSTPNELYLTPFYIWLRHWINWVVNTRWMIVLATGIVFAVTLWACRFVHQQFFPTSTRHELVVTLSLKQGASIDATEAEVKAFEKLIANNPRVEHYSSFIGRNAPRFFLSMPPDLPNLEQGQIVVVAKSFDDVIPLKTDIEKILNNPKNFPFSKGKIALLDFGPPVDTPVVFRVYADTPTEARVLAHQVQQSIQKSPLVKNVSLEWGEKVRAMRVDVDHYKAASYGVNPVEVNQTMQTTMSGLTVSQFIEKDQQIPIMLRASEQDRKEIDLIQWVRVNTLNGQSIPLSVIAQIKPTYEEPTIWRQNRKVFINVMADLNTSLPAPEVSEQIARQYIDSIQATLPPGQKIVAGGAIYESQKANKSLMMAVPFMLLVMVSLMVLQLQNVRGAVVVLCTAPLGFLGVIPLFLITQSAFSFMALVGAVALTGIIMRNTIILVDQIRQNLDQKMDMRTAIVEASVRRFRPVLITASTAIVAMIPLVFDAFWGSMAAAMIAGLTVATLFTIVIEPSLYALFVGRKELEPEKSYR